MLFLRFLLFLWVVDLLYHVSIFPAPNVLALNFPIHNIFFFCYFTLHDFRAFHSPTSISFGNHYSPCSSFPFNFFVVLLCFFGCKRAPNELHTVKIAQENQRCQSVLTNLTYRRDRKCMCVWCRRALENSKIQKSPLSTLSSSSSSSSYTFVVFVFSLNSTHYSSCSDIIPSFTSFCFSFVFLLLLEYV